MVLGLPVRSLLIGSVIALLDLIRVDANTTTTKMELVTSPSSAVSTGVNGDVTMTSWPNATVAPLTCTLILADNRTYADLRQKFLDAAQGNKVIVYFRLYVKDAAAGNRSSFDAGVGPDTFEPEAWVWATSKGKNLLRMPIDYRILSLGLLTINTGQMDIELDSRSADCLRSASVERAIDVVARFLAENLTMNGSLATQDGPVVCRSAFAFSHDMFGQRGIGYSCCQSPTSAGALYDCNKHYTVSWELVWYGPVALLLWVYVIAFVHFYKLYRGAFVRAKIRRLAGISDTIDDIKRDVVGRIVEVSKRIARVHDVDDLLALREDCGYLDVLGVDKRSQATITRVMKVVFVLLLLSAYYVVYALFLYEYRIQIMPQTMERMNDTQTVFLNVIGHFGWLFCRDHLYIFRYAVFEAVYTLLLPLFVGAIYMSIAMRGEAKAIENALSSSMPTAVQRARSVLESAFRGRMLRFADSMPGKLFLGFSLLLVVLYVIALAGPFLTYVIYFSGLGVFANIEVVSPWIIPIVISIHFFMTSFDPVTNLYKRIKDMFFAVCMQKYKQLVIKRQNEIFLPRDLIDTFYVPRSRPEIYASVLRVMWAVAFVILLILVVLTIQYPYYHQTDSIVSFLGVQVVFILPLLSSLMSGGRSMSSLEEGILQGDVDEYIRGHLAKVASGKDPAAAAQNGDASGAAGGDDAGEDGGQIELGIINDGYGGGGDDDAFTNAIVNAGRNALVSTYSNPFKFLDGAKY